MARRLGIGRTTAYDAIASGDFPVKTVRVGGRLFVSRYVLDAFLRGE